MPEPGAVATEPFAGCAETHSAVVYFASERAFKLKPVDLDQPAATESRQLAAMTVRHLRAGAVTLVLAGGLPGTGKTVLDGMLAGRLGWVVLRSDQIRRELAGLPPQAPAPAPFGCGIYTASWAERAYRELLRRAESLLELGESPRQSPSRIGRITWRAAF